MRTKKEGCLSNGEQSEGADGFTLAGLTALRLKQQDTAKAVPCL